MKGLPYIKINEAGELFIDGTQEMDAGEYQCVATNEAGTATGSVILQVGCMHFLLFHHVTHMDDSLTHVGHWG